VDSSFDIEGRVRSEVTQFKVDVIVHRSSFPFLQIGDRDLPVLDCQLGQG